MKKLTVSFFCLVFIFTAHLQTSTSAYGSWWDKGASVLKNLGAESTQKTITVPTSNEIIAAFKEALGIGAQNVVSQLGSTDGFNADPAIHIPLPEELKRVKTVLSKVGMTQTVDNLELKLNRAAEAATPKAKALFLQAIKEMTFDDIQTIYKGPENSATTYFQEKMTLPLSKEMQPIVDNTLSQVGAIQAYDAVMGQYKALPFVPDVKSNLSNHVIEKGLDGLFFYMAKEEAAIRSNPAKQTTELLKKVFGI